MDRAEKHALRSQKIWATRYANMVPFDPNRSCVWCGGVFQVTRARANQGKCVKYCSAKCSHFGARKHRPLELDGDTYYRNVHGYYRSAKTNLAYHRVLWEKHNGPIPDGYLVHHRDEDKANNDISNLELMEWGKHTTLHHAAR